MPVLTSPKAAVLEELNPCEYFPCVAVGTVLSNIVCAGAPSGPKAKSVPESEKGNNGRDVSLREENC